MKQTFTWYIALENEDAEESKYNLGEELNYE